MIRTELGDIKAEVFEKETPITAANFLRYIDARLYDGTSFLRVITREESFPNQEIPIIVAQCVQIEKENVFLPIEHEPPKRQGSDT